MVCNTLFNDDAGINMENRAAIFLAPGDGRSYSMGAMTAVFKADGKESAGSYSISEWWLEPYTKGPGGSQPRRG